MKDRLLRALSKYRDATENLAFLGSKPPEEHAKIRLDYNEALDRLHKLFARVDNDLYSAYVFGVVIATEDSDERVIAKMPMHKQNFVEWLKRLQ